MGWEQGDNVAVEIAGTSVYEIDGVGTKGTSKRNPQVQQRCVHRYQEP